MPQPNILFIMSDQHSIRGVGCYGNPEVKTPHIDALAASGVRFSDCVCPSPLCVPSRAALFAGKQLHRFNCWDNGAPFGCDQPTVLHHLVNAGYSTIASGKLHFIGPDQLHGFKQRLTPDVYPADMIWIDDWDQPLTRDGGNNRDRVAEGGIVQWSPSRDYDEDVHHRAKEKLREIAQQDDPDPFFLYVSFTHPHDPYQTTQDYWDRYEGVDIELPGHWNQPPSGQSTMSQWIQAHHDLSDPVTEEDALTCRRAYYGNCSYIDDKVGELVAELERQGLRENTIVFFASDHGEMLGEHGMWSKRSFYEGSANVPLIINFPGGANAGRTVDSVVGLLDVYPTLLEIAGAEIPDDIDGQSLLSLAAGESRGRDEAFCEYYADGVLAPCRSLRQGNLKFNYTHGEKHELFDLETDPQEMNDLIDSPEHAEIRGRMLARVQEGWNGADIDRRVRESQKRRRFIAEVRLKNGAPWQYETPAGKPRELRKGAGIGCGAPLKGQSKG